MTATAGLVAIGDYETPATDVLKVAALLALIPDPDSTASEGAIAGGGNLDEMSPAAAAQLRVEIAALTAGLGAEP